MVRCMCKLHVDVDAKLGAGIYPSANKVEIYAIGVSYNTFLCFLWFPMGMLEYSIMGHVIIGEVSVVHKHMLQ